MEAKKEARNMIDFSAMKEKSCTVKGCLGLARWVPYAVVKLPDNDNVFNIDFDFPVCDKCKTKLVITDIINDSTIKAIRQLFANTNLTPPSVHHMVLAWNPYIASGVVLPIYNEIGELLDKIELSKKIKLEKV